MSFPQYVSDAALSACGRCCCICHKFCGTKIELHHIKQAAYGGEDTFENCIPLCFNCHADMGKADPKHNKGKKYTESELIIHRDNWYKAVAERGGVSFSGHTEDFSICENDRILFKIICDSFPSGISYWLAHANLYSPFSGEMLSSLDVLLVKDYDPLFSFVSPGLETLKKSLFDKLEAFLEAVSKYTFGIDKDHPGQLASHAWLLNHDYINGRGYDSFEEAESAYDKELELLNQRTTELWQEYCYFAKSGLAITSKS